MPDTLTRSQRCSLRHFSRRSRLCSPLPFLHSSARFSPKLHAAPSPTCQTTCNRPRELFSPIVTLPIRSFLHPYPSEGPFVLSAFWQETRRAALPVGVAASAFTLAASAPETLRPSLAFSPEGRNAPTRARHYAWHDFQERCVTLCHLRFALVPAPEKPSASPSARRFRPLGLEVIESHPAPMDAGRRATRIAYKRCEPWS